MTVSALLTSTYRRSLSSTAMPCGALAINAWNHASTSSARPPDTVVAPPDPSIKEHAFRRGPQATRWEHTQRTRSALVGRRDRVHQAMLTAPGRDYPCASVRPDVRQDRSERPGGAGTAPPLSRSRAPAGAVPAHVRRGRITEQMGRVAAVGARPARHVLGAAGRRRARTTWCT